MKVKQPKAYHFSPKNKSDYTKNMEKIINYIIQQRLDSVDESKTLHMGDKVVIKIDDIDHDLKETLKNTNFTHLKLDESLVEKYQNFLFNKGIFGDNDNCTLQETLEARTHKAKNPAYTLYEDPKELMLIELNAIGRYTGAENTYLGYTAINDLLRGKYPAIIQEENLYSLLINIALISQTLNRATSVVIPEAIRMQDTYGLDEMIYKAENQLVEEVKAFISTSAGGTEFRQGKAPVKVCYHNTKGIMLGRTLLGLPGESEYLIPPSTQIKYTSYVYDGKHHLFTVEGVNVVCLYEEQEMSGIVPLFDE